MDEDRLPTHLWVSANLRRCNDANVPALLVRRGEKSGGLVMLKLNRLDGSCEVLVQQRNIDGVLGWMRVLGAEPVPEAEAEAYVERASGRDPDLWVIEIEHRDGWHPFEGPVF